MVSPRLRRRGCLQDVDFGGWNILGRYVLCRRSVNVSGKSGAKMAIVHGYYCDGGGETCRPATAALDRKRYF